MVAIDGDLAEWRLERWYDIAGPQARLAGDWHGDADLTVRFAMQWNAGGVSFAAQMHDDSLSAPSALRSIRRRPTDEYGWPFLPS